MTVAETCAAIGAGIGFVLAAGLTKGASDHAFAATALFAFPFVGGVLGFIGGAVIVAMGEALN